MLLISLSNVEEERFADKGLRTLVYVHVGAAAHFHCFHMVLSLF